MPNGDYNIPIGTRVVMAIPTLRTAKRSVQWIDAMSGLHMPLGSGLARIWIEDETIAEARNALCKKAIESQCQYIFFLGDDVIPPPNTLLTLLDKIGRQYPLENDEYVKAGMITGVYWTKTYPPEPYLFKYDGVAHGTYRNWVAGEFFPIEIAGVDCVLIDLEELQKVPYPWFSTDWTWSEKQPEPSPIATEDYYFYLKARKHGVYLFADTSIQCFHEDRDTGTWFGLYNDMPQAGGVPAVAEGEVIADLGAGLFTNPALFNNNVKIVRFDARADTKPDVRADIRRIDNRWFGQFDRVHASHVLEHFRRNEAKDVVRHWAHLLKVGGTLDLAVPNFAHAVKVLTDEIPANGEDKKYAWAQIYGDQAKSGPAWQHLNGFTARKLEALIRLAIPEMRDIEVTETDDGLNLRVTAKLSQELNYECINTFLQTDEGDREEEVAHVEAG